jgi:hypothetical protein
MRKAGRVIDVGTSEGEQLLLELPLPKHEDRVPEQLEILWAARSGRRAAASPPNEEEAVRLIQNAVHEAMNGFVGQQITPQTIEAIRASTEGLLEQLNLRAVLELEDDRIEMRVTDAGVIDGTMHVRLMTPIDLQLRLTDDLNPSIEEVSGNGYSRRETTQSMTGWSPSEPAVQFTAASGDWGEVEGAYIPGVGTLDLTEERHLLGDDEC